MGSHLNVPIRIPLIILNWNKGGNVLGGYETGWMIDHSPSDSFVSLRIKSKVILNDPVLELC